MFIKLVTTLFIYMCLTSTASTYRNIRKIKGLSHKRLSDSDFFITIKEDGRFSISVNDIKWFDSSNAFIQANGRLFTTTDNTLRLNSITTV